MHWAAINGHARALEMLLDATNGAVINAADREGNTALHLAVENNRIDAVRVLLGYHGYHAD